jgi:hypothetical protein
VNDRQKRFNHWFGQEMHMRWIAIISILLLGCNDRSPKESPAMELSADDVFWNETVDYWVESDLSELPETHQQMFAAFFYDAEVNNGGHLQYFQNRGVGEATLVQNALDYLNAPELRSNFDRALQKYRAQQRPPIRSLEEYSEIAKEGEFNDEDDKFYSVKPGLWDLIEEEVIGNQSTYHRPE